jgi:hypothetical protein
MPTLIPYWFQKWGTMLRTTVSGKDLIVWVDGQDETPTTFVMHTPMPLADLGKHFGQGALVYLANKNLQRMPQKLKGAIVWLEDLQVIGVIIQSRGVHAHVRILHPLIKKGELVDIKDMMFMNGHYLQYVTGPRPLYCAHMPSIRNIQYHGETLVDKNLCIKMSIEDPSVLLCPKEWREAYNESNLELEADTICTLNKEKLGRKLHTGKQSTTVLKAENKV